jgi:DnaJ-class molecular chaperone
MSEAKSMTDVGESASAPGDGCPVAERRGTIAADVRQAQRAVAQSRCPSCYGYGRLFWRWDEAMTVQCPRCKGTGSVAQARSATRSELGNHH